MFDLLPATDGPSGKTELAAIASRLRALSRDGDDAARIEQVRLLEEIKAVAAAVQARVTAEFAVSQRRQQVAAGVRADRVGQGIAAQVGLARRDSRCRAGRYIGLAQVLVAELPCTFAALERGETTEWRAFLVARETVWLSREHRLAVDAAIGGRLAELGDRQVECETKKLAYGLDPLGFLARSRAAKKDRRVTLRPAPDTMARLTALLPVAAGVAAFAALAAAADAARAAGDARGRGQVMADTLVERVTGQATADDVNIEVQVVMTDRGIVVDSEEQDDTAAANRTEPAANRTEPAANRTEPADAAAHVVGYGPIPVGVARGLIRETAGTVWLRRFYTAPGGRRLTAMDSRRRLFSKKQREAIMVRDEWCRTPWCGAPIRHSDHVRSVADGGETSVDNGQGLCEACNYSKQAPGWTAVPGRGGSGESVVITTPTGHTYVSHPPDLPGASRPPERTSWRRGGPAPPAEGHGRAA